VNADVGEFAECRVEHRLQMPEVRGVDGDLGGEDDLPVVDRGLRVVCLLRRCALGAHHPGVRVRGIDLSLRDLWRHVRLRSFAEPSARRVAPGQPVVLIRSVGVKIDLVALRKPPDSLEQAIVAIAWDRAALTLRCSSSWRRASRNQLTLPPLWVTNRSTASFGRSSRIPGFAIAWPLAIYAAETDEEEGFSEVARLALGKRFQRQTLPVVTRGSVAVDRGRSHSDWDRSGYERWILFK
jgi:hypothetical protein